MKKTFRVEVSNWPVTAETVQQSIEPPEGSMR
jgi:hypothetical protein